jgi:uncharacterized protein with HEPN domain
MKRQKRAIHDYLEDILRYTEKAQRFVADVPSFDAFAEDEMRVMATIRALEVIPIAEPAFTKKQQLMIPSIPFPPARRNRPNRGFESRAFVE